MKNEANLHFIANIKFCNFIIHSYMKFNIKIFIDTLAFGEFENTSQVVDLLVVVFRNFRYQNGLKAVEVQIRAFSL